MPSNVPVKRILRNVLNSAYGEHHPVWCGQSVERVEDAALLTGRGRFIDDLGVKPGTLHAAILRSPHAHATITAIRDRRGAADAGRRRGILTGARHHRQFRQAFRSASRAPIECWPIAVDRVRYVGEPVAVAVASKPLSRRRRARSDRGGLRDDAARRRSTSPRSITPRNRCCTTASARTSSTNAHFVTAILSKPLRDAARKILRHDPLSAQFLHADRRPTASSPNTIRPKTPTTCSPISWGRSVCTA